MKLLIDLQAGVGSNRARGLGRYSWQLASALADRQDVSVELLVNGGMNPAALLAFQERVKREMPRVGVVVFDAPWPWSDGSPYSVEAHQQAEEVRNVLIAARRPDAVLVASLFESPAESVLSIPEERERGYATAIVGYDLLPLTDPTCAPPPQEVEMYYHRLSSARRADRILAISDFSAGEFVQHLPASEDAVVTIWGAAFPLPTSIHRPTRAGIVCAAGAHARKNVLSSLRAYEQLPVAVQRRHPLTVLGNFGPDDVATYLQEADELGLDRGRLHFPGEVTDAQLASMYASAQVVVMPSLGEGLGLPVLEAWAQGTPVAVSNTTSLADLVPDPRYSFDPTDPAMQAARILPLIEDRTAWQDAAEYGRNRSECFTWASTADRVIESLASCATARPVGGSSHESQGRLSLALVTPWPPDLSGIARHAQRLAPEFVKSYDVTLVPETPMGGAQARADGWETVSPEDVSSGRVRFDRVVYNIGNNARFHERALRLSKQVPGVMVAHDMDLTGLMTGVSAAASLEAPITSYVESGLRSVIDSNVPMGQSIFDCGLGVIVHSEHAQRAFMARSRGMAGIPVALAPLVQITDSSTSSVEAKQRLGLQETDLVVATFGIVAPHKGVESVIDAFLAVSEGLPDLMLVVVGGGDDREYQDRLGVMAAGARVVLTGTVSDSEYSDWLCACDIAIQLRPNSKGETSGAAIEALAHGCAVVVERAGSMAELEVLGALGISSPVDVSELAEALCQLVRDPELRFGMQERSRQLTRAKHGAVSVASAYVGAVEEFYANPLVPAVPEWLSDDGIECVARNLRRVIGSPSVLVDVTRVAAIPERSGSQRVTLALASNLARISERAVFLVEANQEGFAHATSFLSMLDETGAFSPDWSNTPEHVTVPGDVLFSAELMLDDPLWREGVVRHKSRGGRYVQVVHDLLPLQYPEFFVDGIEPAFARWLHSVAETADLVVCDSQATLSEFRKWLSTHEGEVSETLDSTWIRLGCNIAETLPPAALRRRRRGCRRVLVVGTIEPRKGVEAVLDAAESLWQDGRDVEFRFVGARGWAMPELQGRLQALSDSDRPLTWLVGASDEELQWEFLNADLLVMASRGEGFGLPVMEAVSYGVPVLARDLPVFRELLGPEGNYFATDRELPGAIEAELQARRGVQVSEGRLVSWMDSAKETNRLVEGLHDRDGVEHLLSGGGL